MPGTGAGLERFALAVIGAGAVAVPPYVLASQIRLHAPTATVEIIVDAAALSWETNRARTITTITGITLAAAGLALAALPAASVLAAMVWTVPVLHGWRAARARGHMRASVSAALTGAMSGGAWTPILEEAGRPPVTLPWDDDRPAAGRGDAHRVGAAKPGGQVVPGSPPSLL
jgi:hypothetical protein